MDETQIFEVSAHGYKPHLCSTEQQVELVIKDIKAKQPESECSTKIFDLPYFCFDDARPLVADTDFVVIDLEEIKLKICVPDFMSLIHNLNTAITYEQDGVVYLSSSICCSVLTLNQAQALKKYLYDNYAALKEKEDAYFIKNDVALKSMQTLTKTLSGSSKKPSLAN